MLTAGLTGGIASGKTMVTHLFRELGAEIIDADEIARQVVEPGRVGLERIKAYFGAGMLTSEGRLDRVRLAAEVFSDRTRLETLNTLLHPLIAVQIHARLESLHMEEADGAGTDDGHRFGQLRLEVFEGADGQIDRFDTGGVGHGDRIGHLEGREGRNNYIFGERPVAGDPQVGPA